MAHNIRDSKSISVKVQDIDYPSLKVKISIPFEDKDQHTDISKKIHRIKSYMFIGIDPKEMEAWIGRRDYDAIKNLFFRIINRHAIDPVRTLFSDFLLYSQFR